MSASIRGRRGSSTALTPLLDMLFLLLFALLATSRSADTLESAAHEEIGIELPGVEGGVESDAPAPTTVEVLVEASGRVVLAGAEVPTPRQLGALLEAALAQDPRTAVELRIDGATPHAVVADVLQATRASGVVDVRFIATDAGARDGREGFGAGGGR